MCIYEFRILFVQVWLAGFGTNCLCQNCENHVGQLDWLVGFSGNMTDNIKQNYVLVLSRSGSSRDYLRTADISDVREAHHHMTWPQWQPGIVFIMRSFHIIIYLNTITKPPEWSCKLPLVLCEDHCVKTEDQSDHVRIIRGQRPLRRLILNLSVKNVN